MAKPAKNTAKRRGYKDDQPKPSPLDLRPSNAPLWDAETIYGLVELFGGAEKMGERLWGRAKLVTPTPPAEQIKDWMRRGFIPPGWHLRLFGMALAMGKTVSPCVFDLRPDDDASRGLYELICKAGRALPRRTSLSR